MSPNTFKAVIHDTHLEVVQLGSNPVRIDWKNITRIQINKYNFQDIGITIYYFKNGDKHRKATQSIVGIGNTSGLYREIKRLFKKNLPDDCELQETKAFGLILYPSLDL